MNHEHHMWEVHGGNSLKGFVRGGGTKIVKYLLCTTQPQLALFEWTISTVHSRLRMSHKHNLSRDSIEVDNAMNIRDFEKSLPPVSIFENVKMFYYLSRLPCVNHVSISKSTHCLRLSRPVWIGFLLLFQVSFPCLDLTVT